MNYFVLEAYVSILSCYKVLGGGVNRRNNRLIGGMILVCPPLCKAFKNAYDHQSTKADRAGR